MIDKSVEWLTLTMYVLAAISGGLGGCAAAGHTIMRGKDPRVSYVLAYFVVGMVFGVLTLSYGRIFAAETLTIDVLIARALLAGVVGSIALASTNITARWILKKLGIEVVVTLRRHNEDRRDDDEPEVKDNDR